MKTGWKIVLIAAAVIAGIGIILGGISLLIGGSFDALADSPVPDTLLRLSPAGIFAYVGSLFAS